MFARLGASRLWDQDEGFFAGAAAEMYARGDAIVPTFNGELFAHKPPLMYWMMEAGYWLFDVSEFGARFFSAVAGLLTAVLTCLLGRRLFSGTAGLFAGLALGSCLMFSIVSRAATADAYLTLFAVTALYLWCRDLFPEGAARFIPADGKLSGGEPRRSLSTHPALAIRWSTWAASYAVLSLAVLTKGPIGVLFPMAVLGLYLLCQTPTQPAARDTLLSRLLPGAARFGPRNFVYTVWLMRPFTALALVALIAGPWYYLVHQQTHGAFLKEFIEVHHLSRFSAAMENHSGPVFYYLLACLIGMFPWSAFAIPIGLAWWGGLCSTLR